MNSRRAPSILEYVAGSGRAPVVRGLLRRGDAANRRRAWNEAETAYAAALEQAPDLAAIWVQYGHALKEQGKLPEAEAAYRRSLELHPDIADTHLQLGHALKLRNRKDEAADAYLTAYRLDGASPFPAIELEALGLQLPPPPRDGDGSDYGISAAAVSLFDLAYYVYGNPTVEHALAEPDFPRALAHLCTRGIDALLPIHPDFKFDPAFYCDTYIGYQLTGPNAYWHWLSVGAAHGWQPNKEQWVKDFLDDHAATIASLDLNWCWRFFYAGERDIKWIELFERFADAEVLLPGPHLPINNATADFFLAIAERFAENCKIEEAARIYGRILLDVPEHRRTLLCYAEFLAGRGMFHDALALYQRVLDLHGASPKPLLRQAECYAELGEFPKALRLLKTGTEQFPDNREFVERTRAICDGFLEQRWNQGIARGVQGDPEGAQQLVAAACGFLADLFAARECSSSPFATIENIAIVGIHSVPQCRFYRVEQKAEQLEAAGYDVTVFDGDGDLRDFKSNLHRFDAVIFYRVPSWGKIVEAITRSRELGLVTFYEIDDLIFTNQDFPDEFETFGGLITPEDYIGLKLGVPFYRTAMSLCDYGIASTPALAREMQRVVRSGRVYVHRNGFGTKHERYANARFPRVSRDRVTIFYGSGTKSHKADFQDIIEDTLVRLVKQHGEQLKIILAGYNVLTERLSAIEDNICMIGPLWSYDDYWSILQNVDINIAVLLPNLMTDCKSEIKWIEASIFGIPSVVSGTAVYREIIDHGVTGFICDTADEWENALDLLISDPGTRRAVGENAHKRVKADYSLDRMSYNLKRIMSDFTAGMTRNPKILIVNIYYPPFSIGGATRVVEDNVRFFRVNHAKEFDIEVFSTSPGATKSYEIDTSTQEGVRVSRMVLQPDEALDDVEDSEVCRVFGEFLDRSKPDLIHFHCIQGLTASIVKATRERGIPYVITAHDAWWIADHQFLTGTAEAPPLYNYADPISLLSKQGAQSYLRAAKLQPELVNAAAVLAVSQKFASIYESTGLTNVSVVENGISEFDDIEKTPSPDGRVRLAFIGGLVAAKGFDLLRSALWARNYENLTLTVIETGREPGDVAHRVWNTTPVQFVPGVPAARMGAFYAGVDVLLAPSVCVESFGLATREALRCGCWVVASDRGSAGDCVSPGKNGHIIDVSTPAALIDALTAIDQQPQRYRQSPEFRPILRHAREQAADLAALYRSILAPAGKSARLTFCSDKPES